MGAGTSRQQCVGSDCSVPQPAVLCMSGQSPGLVRAVRNPLLRPRLGFHCCVNQNPWLADAYLCLEGHAWVTECPSFSQHCHGIVLFVVCCCVSSYSPFSRDLGAVFLSSALPWLVYSCRHGSAVAPPSLSHCHCSESPNHNTTLVPFTMYNHGEIQERNVSCVDSLSELLAAAV